MACISWGPGGLGGRGGVWGRRHAERREVKVDGDLVLISSTTVSWGETVGVEGCGVRGGGQGPRPHCMR